ncbi:MAG: (d)CMP kinase [Clostridiales bacterium]|jgi:cytidylate kinase|nr:(d)CMP kinase [Clostridiales bacterium]
MIHITIDGPSGAGKSTVAKAAAKKLGIIYLDTGAIYRAFAYAALQNGVDINDEAETATFLASADIAVGYTDGGVQNVFFNGADVTEFIREHNISKAASDISRHIPVRIRLSEIQREIAKRRDVVLDGRDAGTFVLPDANFKFYLTADVEERARRRYAEIKKKNGTGGANVDYEKVLSDIKIRDFNDSNRSFAPLKKAEDAELIDSTRMNAEEVAEYIVKTVEKKTGHGRRE